jgi:hypothetical protein
LQLPRRDTRGADDLHMDDTMRLSCPSCRAIDWSRDGLTMAVDINGDIHRVRVNRADPTTAAAPWECERCGFRPIADSDLANHLVEIQQVAHVS